MNGDKGNLPEFINRIKVELRQDKKKATMLVILLVVGGIVGGRFVVSHGPPFGSEPQGRRPDNASAAGSGRKTKSPLPAAGRNPDVHWDAVPAGNSERQASQVDFSSMDRTIDRDLFWPNTRYFPSAGQVDTPPAATQPDQAQQLAAAKQREHLRRMEHVKSIREQAKTLCLTSTMLGRSPTALINGQVLRTGEMIKEFRLKSIAPDYCIVTRENVDVKLQMKE